ncbi:hypothetical protein V1511DRAFT_164211 [Dipodascopsis uninucleata]
MKFKGRFSAGCNIILGKWLWLWKVGRYANTTNPTAKHGRLDHWQFLRCGSRSGYRRFMSNHYDKIAKHGYPSERSRQYVQNLYKESQAAKRSVTTESVPSSDILHQTGSMMLNDQGSFKKENSDIRSSNEQCPEEIGDIDLITLKRRPPKADQSSSVADSNLQARLFLDGKLESSIPSPGTGTVSGLEIKEGAEEPSEVTVGSAPDVSNEYKQHLSALQNEIQRLHGLITENQKQNSEELLDFRNKASNDIGNLRDVFYDVEGELRKTIGKDTFGRVIADLNRKLRNIQSEILRAYDPLAEQQAAWNLSTEKDLRSVQERIVKLEGAESPQQLDKKLQGSFKKLSQLDGDISKLTKLVSNVSQDHAYLKDNVVASFQSRIAQLEMIVSNLRQNSIVSDHSEESSVVLENRLRDLDARTENDINLLSSRLSAFQRSLDEGVYLGNSTSKVSVDYKKDLDEALAEIHSVQRQLEHVTNGIDSWTQTTKLMMQQETSDLKNRIELIESRQICESDLRSIARKVYEDAVMGSSRARSSVDDEQWEEVVIISPNSREVYSKMASHVIDEIVSNNKIGINHILDQLSRREARKLRHLSSRGWVVSGISEPGALILRRSLQPPSFVGELFKLTGIVMLVGGVAYVSVFAYHVLMRIQ